MLEFIPNIYLIHPIMPHSTRLRPTLLAVLAMFAVATSGRAQLLTANTLTAFDPTYSFNNGVQLTNFGATQTFSNISSITDLTLRFVTESTTSFSTTSMSYAFGSWTGSSLISPTAPLGPPPERINIWMSPLISPASRAA